MAESKRMFRKGNMNRDLDDRLVNPETYRYANNIKVGSSEGGDMGAVENLKGNEKLAGQDEISGTTIGSVKDPNSSKVYFFNTSNSKDAIYEYDDSTGDINTILVDNPDGDLKKPSCRPELSTSITGPDSDIRVKPDLDDFPDPPTTGCGLSSSTHTSSNGLFYPTTAEVRDDSLCQLITTYGCDLPSSTHTSSNGLFYPATANTAQRSLCTAITSVQPVARITGNTTATIGTDVVLSSSSSTAGSFGSTNYSISSRAWQNPTASTSSVTISGSGRTNGETVTVTLTITNNANPAQTDTTTHTITFSSPPSQTAGCGLSSSDYASSNGLYYPATADTRDDSLCVLTYGCDLPSSTHSSSNGRFYPANANTADRDLCVPRVSVDPVAVISGDTQANIGTNVALGSSSSTAGSFDGDQHAIASKSWSWEGNTSTADSITVTGSGRSAGDTVTVTLQITNDANPAQSDTDTHTVTFNAAASPVTVTINHNEGILSDVDVSGSITYTGDTTNGVSVNFNGTLAPSEDYAWADELPEATLSAPVAGLTFNGLVNSNAGITETLRTTLIGTYTGTTNITRTITWAGDDPVDHVAQCPYVPANFLSAAGQTRTRTLSGYSSAPTISGAPSWLTASATATVITLSAGANAGPNSRTATLTLSGGGTPSGSTCSFSVEQAAPAYNPQGLDLDLTSSTAGSGGWGNYTANLTNESNESSYDVQYMSTNTIVIRPWDGSTVPSSGITYTYGTMPSGWQIASSSGNTVSYFANGDQPSDFGGNSWTIQMLQNGTVVSSATLGLYAGDHDN